MDWEYLPRHQAIVDQAFEQLSDGQVRVSDKLRKRNLFVSPGGMRSPLNGVCADAEYLLSLVRIDADSTSPLSAPRHNRNP